jgi:hypothetical protein
MTKNPYLKNWFIDARNECFGEPLELSETGDFWGRYWGLFGFFGFPTISQKF